jgi:acetyltransferase-like isoleucine patch superfamily enzyme
MSIMRHRGSGMNLPGWTKSILTSLKRNLLMQRPFGLGALGRASRIEWPRTLRGRGNIFIGHSSHVRSHSHIEAVNEFGSQSYSPRIVIGDGVYVGRYAYLTSCNSITIGNGTVLSEHVYVTDLNHGFDPEGGPIMKQSLTSKGPVCIGENCFLGYRASVMPGVTLGNWCIVGANSVVTKSFPAYSMIVGQPAQVIRLYSTERGLWIDPKTNEQ